MVPIILAVVGWFLFALVAFMYWKGNTINARDEVAMELFCLSLILSDEFRELNLGSCHKFKNSFGGETNERERMVIVYRLALSKTPLVRANYANGIQI